MTEGDWQVEIAPEEVVVRAIKTPYHVNLKKQPPQLKHQAFRPDAECDDVSVMRKRHLGNDGCKSKAIEIGKNAYIGLAALRAEEIIAVQAQVLDSREGNYLGHAQIEQGIPAPPKGVPADPELIERWAALANTARFHIDPQRDSPDWTGPDLI